MNYLRRLYFYFGRDEKWNWPAFPLQNTLVAGRVGSGKGDLLNSLLVKLIQECSPNMLDIRIHNFNSTDLAVWSETMPKGRWVPHITQLVNYSIGRANNVIAGDYRYDISEFVKDLNDLADLATARVAKVRDLNVSDYTEVSYNNCYYKAILFAVNEFQVVAEDEQLLGWFNETISYIMSMSSISGVYVMLLSSNFSCLSNSAIDLFGIKAILPVDERISNILLDCNCAARERVPSGVVWVKTGNNFPIRLWVPFYPDTWLRKFIGYSSVKV